jgi:hypothetical protein
MRREIPAVERPVVKWATDRRIKVTKNNPEVNAGWPDRTFWIPGGRPVIMEFKWGDEQPSDLQKNTIRELEALGYVVYVVNSKEKGIAILRAALEAARVSKKGNEVPRPAGRGRPVPGPRSRKD